MSRLVVVAWIGVAACASHTPQERMLLRVFADARGDRAAFAAHFAPDLASEVDGLRTSFAGEHDAPKFEQGRGPVCVRAYWGDYLVDHGYYFYLRAIDKGYVITDVVYDSGFGPAFASFGSMEDRDPPDDELGRCTAANASSTPPVPR